MRLPTPVSISYFWNLGRLLGILIIIQILRGWLLTLFYSNLARVSFDRVWRLHLESWRGNLLHLVHLNFASFIFLILYFHLLKGLYFQSWKTNKLVWISGLVIFILIMAISFLGYVLPFGQISLWGATVITNLISIISKKLVIWIWGGFRVNDITLKFFFTLHFTLPIILLLLIVVHLVLLHYNGRTNLGVKTHFWPLFVYKDILNLVIILFFIWFMLKYSYFTSDADNFLKANLRVSPIHIKPEWYFLVFYAILRSIPNKVIGVFFFVFSLVSLFLLSLNPKITSSFYFPIWSLNISIFVSINLLLFIIGIKPVEYPFLEAGQILTVLYFIWIFLAINPFSIFQSFHASPDISLSSDLYKCS
jgi:ubiquinol-cytochrome c reductase cytochrome b subunit